MDVYAELEPHDRHRSFIDHLFVRRCDGRLADIGHYLFASPLSEIVLIGRRQVHAGRRDDGVIAWKARHLPPRFGRQPRGNGFQGWMLGVRCRPLDARAGKSALIGLSESFSAALADKGEDHLDTVVDALDTSIDHLRPRLDLDAMSLSRAPPIAGAPERIFSASRGDSVAAVAAALGIVPRTLQRRFRERTGLTPKRYSAVQRFSGALRQVALGPETLAQIASDSGYCDQAHLTMDLGRHAGLPPGRFRALAQDRIVRDAVRFFKDADLQARVRLLISDPEDAISRGGR